MNHNYPQGPTHPSVPYNGNDQSHHNGHYATYVPPAMGQNMNMPMAAPTAQHIPTHAAAFNSVKDQTMTGTVFLKDCVLRSRYDFYDAAIVGTGNRELLKSFNGKNAMLSIEDHSKCSQIFWCSDLCRSYRLDVTDHQGSNVAHLEKDCQMTCCCLNRPRAKIHTQASAKPYKVRDICRCLADELELEGPSGEHLYTYNRECCQAGVICPMPCAPCNKVKFDVVDKQHQKVVKGETVMNLTSWCCSELSTSSIKFSPNVPVEHKVALATFVAFSHKLYNESRQSSADDL